MRSLPGLIFKNSFVWGGFLTARFALQGVRFHPGSRIFGDLNRVRLCRGSRVSRQVVMRICGEGRIVLGSRVWLAEGVQFETDRVVEVGNETSIQARSFIHGRVAIGRGCLLAPGVFASSGTHIFRQWPALPIRIQEERAATAADFAERFHRPVVIEDDCWIGINATISPGVTIGKGAIVGANAVVTRDVVPYCVVGGVPAHPISKRLDWKPPRQLDATSVEAIPYLCGFDLRLDGDTVIATCGEAATMTLAAGAVGRISIDVTASERTGLSIGTNRFELSPGLNRLSVTDTDTLSTMRFGIPHILLPLAHPAAGTAKVNLLTAALD